MRVEYEREFDDFVTAVSRRLLHAGDLPTGDRTRAEDLAQHGLAAGYARWPSFRQNQKPVGHEIALGTRSGGERLLAWIVQRGAICYGERNQTTANCSQPSASHWMTFLPTAYQMSEWRTGDDPARSWEGQLTVLSGLVAGPVSRVEIALPGGLTEARQVPAPDPRLGTFYWVITHDYKSGGNGAALPARTVYRDGTPVFHCQDEECLPRF